MTRAITLKALSGIPLVKAGDDLTGLILEALARDDETLQTGDALVISSKIVSKAEGRMIALETVNPSAEAVEVATETRKDPRLVELVLQESVRISRKAPGILVTQHRLGFISANAGIDQSNVMGNTETALLLPLDPDGTAERIRAGLEAVTGGAVGVVISDSHGRPFRMGNIGVAIGAAGLPTLLDLRGQKDLFGYELKISMQGYGDLVASAAHLACGEGDEGLPVILVRGLAFQPPYGTANDLNRSPQNDLYR